MIKNSVKKKMDTVRGVILVSMFCYTLAFSIEKVCTSESPHDVQNNVKEMQKGLSAQEILQNSYSMITRSSRKYWEGIKSVVNQLQSSLFQPDIDFRIKSDEDQDSAGLKMKEAAKKSFQVSKEAVEESAKSAAKAVGKAAHKTAEEVKERTHASHTEL